MHVAKGGPAAGLRPPAPPGPRQHRRGLDVGEWTERPAGSGRELCWFPDPVGGVDCYRAALADAVLPGLPGARPDRSTRRHPPRPPDLPVLRRPTRRAVRARRVEVGRDGVRDVKVLGAMDRPRSPPGRSPQGGAVGGEGRILPAAPAWPWPPATGSAFLAEPGPAAGMGGLRGHRRLTPLADPTPGCKCKINGVI